MAQFGELLNYNPTARNLTRQKHLIDGYLDILKAESGGYYVTELNGIPGWKGLQKTTDVDIAGRIVEHVMEFAAKA